MISWMYLFIAALCEIGWIYSLKYMEFKKLIKTNIVQVLSTKEGMLLLIPVLLYVLFGIANIVLFSKAMEKIPSSTAFAVWTAIALIGVRLVDVYVLKESFSSANLLFFFLIIIGIIGLKIF